MKETKLFNIVLGSVGNVTGFVQGAISKRRRYCTHRPIQHEISTGGHDYKTQQACRHDKHLTRCAKNSSTMMMLLHEILCVEIFLRRVLLVLKSDVITV